MIISNSSLRFGVFLVLVLPLLVACDDTTSETGKRPKKDHLVEVHQAGIQAMRTRLTASGSLLAERNVRIFNELSAKIVELPHYPGDRISAGDVLVKLDDRLIAAELEKAVALRKQAETDLERVRKLGPKQLASADEIARAETELDIAVADETLQRTRLKQTVIRAPFDGVITERLFEPGDVVAMHSHIHSMIDPDSLILLVRLSEQWMPFVALGDHVSVTIGSLGSEQHDAVISRIYPEIDSATRKGTLEISFRPQPFGARAGQLATAELYTHSVDRLVIPSHTLHHDSTGAYVYVLDDEDKARKQHVVKGQQYGEMLSIVSGLNASSRVVSKGFIGLRNGKQVKVVEPSATTSVSGELFGTARDKPVAP